MKRTSNTFTPCAVIPALVFALGALSATQGAAPSHRTTPADLTQGGKPDDTHDWTLGPTGARGWIWGWLGQSTDARQILITETTAGSPCDGILQKGDVLLGVNGKPFDSDARILFARAITEAEKDKGILNLSRWRDGKSEHVQIKLTVLGTYSATAPYNCPKSKRILELGCQAIAKEGFKEKTGKTAVSIPNDLNALALLASGLEPYRALTAEYAHTVMDHHPGGHVSWGYGYDTLFLAEYALATKDQTVMPGLRRLALDIAHGQSGVGTWGHSFARSDDHILNGYGNMNQPGIILTLAMAVAREAGVKDPALDAAIDKSARFLRYYVNKGSIPYGDHAPWRWHDDNGKNSSAAVLFDLLGDREAAAYFSRMATAAYNERESGHTGSFFGHLWALPGVSRCGQLATGAYLKEQDWFYDLARCWDGRFIHQPTPGDWENYNYILWDSTGAYLLTYALPLKLTIVTGRKPGLIPPLTAPAVAETIAAGRDFSYWNEKSAYDGRSSDELFAGLASWSPAVRRRSADALGHREGDFLPRLLPMLTGATVYARYGACEALGCLGPKADPAAAKVRALLASPDPWLRSLAADALVRMGPQEQKASVADLLKAVVINDPADKRKRVVGPLVEALFHPAPGQRDPQSILSKSLDGVDRPLLYAAIRDILKNQDGRIRGSVAPLYKMMTPKDIAVLLPDIVEAIRKPAPSGEMFAYDIRMSGLDLLATWHIKEGMTLCVDIMGEFRWGRDIERCTKPLAKYGAAAKPLVPRIREILAQLTKSKGENNRDKDQVGLAKIIADLEAENSTPPLRTMREFIAHPPEKP